jgi:hypothetical protein
MTCAAIFLFFGSKQFQKILAKQGLNFKLNTKVTAAEKRDGKVFIKTEAVKDGKEELVRQFRTSSLRDTLLRSPDGSSRLTSSSSPLAVDRTPRDSILRPLA